MLPAASVPLDLYPPVSHDPRWWWVVAGCLLAAVVVMWGCRRVLAAIDSAVAGDGPVTLETVRAAALQDLEEAKDASERCVDLSASSVTTTWTMRAWATFPGAPMRMRGSSRWSRLSSAATRWSSTQVATASI